MISTQVVALAGLVLLAACRMQRVTARGDVTVPGDPDRDAMAAALHWVSKAMIVVVAALVRAEFTHWFGGSRPNFRTLSLRQIDVDSADFWTNGLLPSGSRSTAENLASKRSHTRTLKSG